MPLGGQALNCDAMRAVEARTLPAASSPSKTILASLPVSPRSKSLPRIQSKSHISAESSGRFAVGCWRSENLWASLAMVDLFVLDLPVVRLFLYLLSEGTNNPDSVRSR